MKWYGLSHVMWANQEDELRALLRGKSVVRVGVDTEGNQEPDWDEGVDPTLVQIALELTEAHEEGEIPSATQESEIIVILYAPLIHDRRSLEWLRAAIKGLYVYVW